MDSKDEAIAFLDAVVPRMRSLGVAEFVYGVHTVKLGDDPERAKVPAPAQRPRLTAVELALAGPPVEPVYADAKPPGK